MQAAPPSRNEAQRLEKLKSYGVLDTLPQEAFDDITALASSICDTPIALITLVDQDRQWFKSRHGVEVAQTPRNISFCAHAINDQGHLMEVEDTTLDGRFSDNPLIAGGPRFRFYAGAPIVTDDGFALGTVCVIDRRARCLDDRQRNALKSLANLVVSLLEHQKEHLEFQSLRAAEAKRQTALLAAVTAAGLDLISYVDSQYVYRYVNAQYLTYFNKSESEIVGHSVANLMGPEAFLKKVKPNFDRALAGEVVNYEVLMDFPGMGPRHIEVTYLPSKGESGELTGVVVRVHDIHVIKQGEEKLKETVALLQQKTLEQERFIHIISHDLREPINTITNFAGLLAEDDSLALPDHAQRYLQFVRSGSFRMKSLLEELLNFLHLDRHAIQRVPVDLTQLAADVRDDLDATLTNKGGRIEFDHLHTATGDATLLRILLQNLVSNALKFSREGIAPVVKITSSLENDVLHLQVCDNGIGIVADQTDSIFDIFTRLHSKKEFEGSGLGLSICKRIAELHGGSVSVTSIAGSGSRFALHLPVVPVANDDRNGDEHL